MKTFITDNQKLIGGILMFALWTGLVIWDNAPAADLIFWIKIGLGAVFGLHTVTNFTANKPPSPVEPKPPQEPIT